MQRFALVCIAAWLASAAKPFEIQAPVCGNGVVEDGEQCDDGNVVAGDGCDELCKIEPPATPTKPVCGNGVKEDGEQCDDGNTRNLDGCDAHCRIRTLHVRQRHPRAGRDLR